VQVSAWGTWWVDATLSQEIELARGAVAQLVFAGVPMVGTIVSGGTHGGTSGYRIVGGRGGWGKTIEAKAYADDAGAKLATIISDAARDCEEIVEGVPATRTGPNFARRNVSASSVLNALTPQAWRVDFDGVTRFGPRPTVAYTGSAPRTYASPQAAVVELATDDISGLLPGVTIDGSDPATDVEYLLDEKRLTVRVYAGRASARRPAAIASIVDALMPELKWAGTFEFRVVAQTGERFTLQPVRAATGLPELEHVTVRGPAGVKAIVTPGELVLVSFVDRDPARPVIVAHDEPDAPGWMPLVVQLGESPALGIARQTDPVQAGPFAGAIVLGSLRVKAGL
jgi:hypothetical protein